MVHAAIAKKTMTNSILWKRLRVVSVLYTSADALGVILAHPSRSRAEPETVTICSLGRKPSIMCIHSDCAKFEHGRFMFDVLRSLVIKCSRDLPTREGFDQAFPCLMTLTGLQDRW